MQAILTKNLKKVYLPRSIHGKKPILALDNLNLEVESGEIYGFIGPNGAGKTTAIKILIGLLPPNGGEAFIFGGKAGSLKARGQLGYLSEISYYYPFMEAGELLDYYGQLFGMEKKLRRRRIDEVISQVNLKAWKNQRISDFSKGMLQRFGIAQALISKPPLLILDEPTSGLDPIGQKEIKEIILNLKSEGLTIFFSSHKLTEVETICDKIGIIHQGKMLLVDELAHLLKPGTTLEEIFFNLITQAEKEEIRQ
jgi:ABC-2 type transport system ATP-binding protein